MELRFRTLSETTRTLVMLPERVLCCSKDPRVACPVLVPQLLATAVLMRHQSSHHQAKQAKARAEAARAAEEELPAHLQEKLSDAEVIAIKSC